LGEDDAQKPVFIGLLLREGRGREGRGREERGREERGGKGGGGRGGEGREGRGEGRGPPAFPLHPPAATF